MCCHKHHMDRRRKHQGQRVAAVKAAPRGSAAKPPRVKAPQLVSMMKDHDAVWSPPPRLPMTKRENQQPPPIEQLGESGTAKETMPAAGR